MPLVKLAGVGSGRLERCVSRMLMIRLTRGVAAELATFLWAALDGRPVKDCSFRLRRCGELGVVFALGELLL